MPRAVPRFWHSIIAGAWRFTVVSVAGFAPWFLAGRWFHRYVGEAGLYAACLLAFLVTAVVMLPGLLSGERCVRRTTAYFLPAFTAYALLWCACWFLLGGRAGEVSGALLGGTAFTLITSAVLGRPRSLVLATILVVTLQTLGYFAGGMAMHELLAAEYPIWTGMMSWGVLYGLGFGAGLGWLTYACTDRRT